MWVLFLQFKGNFATLLSRHIFACTFQAICFSFLTLRSHRSRLGRFTNSYTPQFDSNYIYNDEQHNFAQWHCTKSHYRHVACM